MSDKYQLMSLAIKLVGLIFFWKEVRKIHRAYNDAKQNDLTLHGIYAVFYGLVIIA